MAAQKIKYKIFLYLYFTQVLLPIDVHGDASADASPVMECVRDSGKERL